MEYIKVFTSRRSVEDLWTLQKVRGVVSFGERYTSTQCVKPNNVCVEVFTSVTVFNPSLVHFYWVYFYVCWKLLFRVLDRTKKFVQTNLIFHLLHSINYHCWFVNLISRVRSENWCKIPTMVIMGTNIFPFVFLLPIPGTCHDLWTVHNQGQQERRWMVHYDNKSNMFCPLTPCFSNSFNRYRWSTGSTLNLGRSDRDLYRDTFLP